MDWREVRFDIANDVVPRNASLPSLTDWRRGRSISHFILSIIPVKENNDADLKHHWPNSMDTREVRFDIANDMVLKNASSPSLTDWSRGRSISHFILSIIPINENEAAEFKPFSPISTVSSASNSVNSNDFADWNALLLILNDFSDFISNDSYVRFVDTLHHNRWSTVECIISKCYRAKRGKICSQS